MTSTYKSVQAAGELFLLPSQTPPGFSYDAHPDTTEKTEAFLRSTLGVQGFDRVVAATDDGRLDVHGVAQLVWDIFSEYTPMPPRVMV